MNIKLVTDSEAMQLNLESLIIPVRQVIWIGRKDDAVYNTVHVDCEDTFLCSIAFAKDTGAWTLTNGQVRTHCPRGLRSYRSKACSACQGCCAYHRTANPDYSLRVPKSQTLINGNPVPEEGVLLCEGDTISFAL